MTRFLIPSLDFGGGGAAPSVPPYDSLSSTPVAAYGQRQLFTAYTDDKCIKVRRSGDNAEMDFGFSGAELDTAALVAWVVAGGGTQHGYIVTWYDQSGNGRHATQSTAAAQTQIVNSGSLLTGGTNSRPRMLFDGVDDYMIADAVATAFQTAGSPDMVAFALTTTTAAGTSNRIMSFHDASGANRAIWTFNEGGADRVLWSGASGNFVTSNAGEYDTNEYACWEVTSNSSNSHELLKDGWSMATGSGTHNFSDITQFSIGQEWDGGTPSDFLIGSMAELIIFDEIPSAADRETIRTNQADWFGFDSVTTLALGIGGVKDTSVKYKVRAKGVVTLEYSTSSDLSGSTISAGTTPLSGDDYVGGETITGLSADTTYYYTPRVDGTRVYSSPFAFFKTLPAAGIDADMTILWSGCMTDGDEATIFASMSAESPDLFLHLGDFGYPDVQTPNGQWDNYRDMYDSVVSDDYVAEIVRKMGVEHTWDDHDYGEADGDGEAPGKAIARRVRQDYVPSHDYDNEENGIHRQFDMGNAEVFMLDVYYNSLGANVRFPGAGSNTADTGSSGNELVLRAADSPSGTDDFYNGYYAEITTTSGTFYRRVTDYTQADRKCILTSKVPTLSSASTYFLKKASMLDKDYIVNNQVDFLIDGINNSTARWKIICSSLSINPTVTIGEGWVTHDVDLLELNYIKQAIADNAENVFCLTSDRHEGAGDDGTNTFWPSFLAGPLNEGNPPADGSWSQGEDVSGLHYGRLVFSGTDVTLSVRNADGTQASVTPLTLAGWTPADQTTGGQSPDLWLDAGKGTFQSSGGSAASEDGDVVGEWQDQSGSGNDVTQSTAGNKPLLKVSVVNERKVIRFDGTDDYLEAATNAILDYTTESLSIFIVAKATGGGTEYYLSKYASNGGYRFTDSNSGGDRLRYQARDTVDALTVVEAATITSFHIFGVIHTHGGNAQLRQNGANLGSAVDFSAVDSKTNTDKFAVGENSSSKGTGNALAGDIAEILIYPAALDATDIGEVETYLANKYGISI